MVTDVSFASKTPGKDSGRKNWTSSRSPAVINVESWKTFYGRAPVAATAKVDGRTLVEILWYRSPVES